MSSSAVIKCICTIRRRLRLLPGNIAVVKGQNTAWHSLLTSSVHYILCFADSTRRCGHSVSGPQLSPPRAGMICTAPLLMSTLADRIFSSAAWHRRISHSFLTVIWHVTSVRPSGVTRGGGYEEGRTAQGEPSRGDRTWHPNASVKIFRVRVVAVVYGIMTKQKRSLLFEDDD